MIHIREALKSDNAGLLYLTSLSPMEGKISIRIDRNPDFFRLLDLRGPSKLYVAENSDTIIGCFSLSIMDTLVNGNPGKLHYLADLKIHPSYLGTTLTSRLLNLMFKHLLKIKADLLFCTVAKGNDKVMPLLAGRIGFPEYECIGTFNVYQIIPFNKRIDEKKYNINDVVLNDNLVVFYTDFLKRYQMAPVIDEEMLKGMRHLVAIRNNDIKAAISLIDVGNAKQNVLLRLPFGLNILVILLRTFSKTVHILNLPETGEPVKIMYIRVFACRVGYEDALDLLVNHARKLCFTEKYCFLSVAIHERDPFRPFFKNYLHFTFNSLGFMASLHGDNEKISSIKRGIVYEDYSLV